MSFFKKTLPPVPELAGKSVKAPSVQTWGGVETPKTAKTTDSAAPCIGADTKRDVVKQKQQEKECRQQNAAPSRRSSARSSPAETETQAAAPAQTGPEHATLSSDSAPVDDKHLSEYEKLRQANIKRNQELLVSLEIHTTALSVAPQTPPQSKTKLAKKRKMEALEEPMEPRRSGRRLAASQEQEQHLVALPNSWDEGDERKTASNSTKPKAAIEVEDQDWGALEAPPTMMELLNDLSLAQTKVLAKCTALQDWKTFAEEKWGKLVSKAKVHDWQLYVSRSHSIHPPSALAAQCVCRLLSGPHRRH